jgi:threonine/homoserine/homoserine lactone efflux protein
MLSAWGVGLGNLILALGAALGLSAVLASSDLAFSTVKYLGAGYLIYLGVRRLLERGDSDPTLSRTNHVQLRRVFLQGMVVEVLNPKTALFYLAFLPLFVNPGGSIKLQLLTLGLIFVALGLCTDTLYGVLSGTTGSWLRRRSRLSRPMRYLTGGTYLALGVTAALTTPVRVPAGTS